MIFLILLINFVVSWVNCWSCGGIWAEAKALGGFLRVLAWCGAIQAAIGFSSVIGFIAGAILFHLGYLPPRVAHDAASLWYLLVIFPALGTGLIITIQSWIVAFRERSLANMGVAAYNTYAQIHNTLGAIEGFGEAFSGVTDLFSLGASSDSDSEDSSGALVVLAVGLVAFALGSGVLLTMMLIKRYSGRLPLPA